MRVLLFTDSNHVRVENVYYYLRMTKHFIEKIISGIEYQELFLDISTPANICNMSDDGSDKEEPSSNDYTVYTYNIRYVISKFGLKERKYQY